MAAKGIRSSEAMRVLEADDPLPWETFSRVVRLLIIDTKLDDAGKPLLDKSGWPVEEVYFAYNSSDQTGHRPAGYGLPGGRAKKREGSLDALEREVSEEVPYPILGEPIFLLSYRKSIGGQRIEKVDLYLAKVDRTNTHALKKGSEVGDGRFWDKREIWSQPVVDTRPDAQEAEESPESKRRGFYKSHLDLCRLGLKKRGELIEEGIIRP